MNEFNEQEVKAELIQELNLADVDKEEREKIIDELMEIVMERVAVAVLSKVPKEEYNTIDSMLDGGDTDKLVNRLKVLVPDADKVAKGVISQSLNEFKELMRQETGNA